MKLKTKFFLLFSLIAVIPLAVLTVFAYSLYYHVTEERMSEIVSSQFENISRETQNAYDSAKQVLSLLTFYSQDQTSIYSILQRFSRKEEPLTGYEIYRASRDIQGMCQNVAYAYPFVYGVFVFTPDGDLISYSSQQSVDITPDYSPLEDQWYQDTLDLKGKIYISGTKCHSMFDMDRECTFLAQSLQDIDTHSNLGVIVLCCSPSLFNLDTVNVLGDSVMITLENRQNGQSVYQGETTNLTDQKDRALTEVLEDTSLELTMIFDYDSLFLEYQNMGYLLLLFAVCCILLAILLSWMFSKSLVVPIQDLSSQMLYQRTSHQIERKDYSGRKDEIGILYRQYYAMLDQLEESIKRDYQDKLILLDAQMKSLEARINSHFLFNTLESINSMAELEDNAQIATMSLALGNMFRYAIKTDSELVTLEQELKNVQDYVSIQSIRFDDKFRLEEDIPGECRQIRVLKLILQPLVENALKHGLCYCSTGDWICIRARNTQDGLTIVVEDNGQGIDREQLEKIQGYLAEEASFTELGHRDRQSIGLKNIQSRIELYYGKGYGISVESISGKGTRIMIRIPVLTGGEGGGGCTDI